MGNRRKLNNKSRTKGVVTVNAYYLDIASAGITEGVVSDAVAISNKNIINSEIQAAVTAGATTFVIPTMDAYFNTSELTTQTKNQEDTSVNGIVLPSNLNIQMQPTTYLRCQPNDRVSYTMFSLWDVDNITITGGNIIGDKYDHIYRQEASVSTAGTTTTAVIKIQKEYVSTSYTITITPNNATTQASEIAAYITTNVTNMTATSSGTNIIITPDAGIYVLIDDDATDASGINFTYGIPYTFEYGYCIAVFGSHNITIDNVSMSDAMGDGVISGIKYIREPIGGIITAPNRTTNNLLIKNCIIDNNRRQGISIIDTSGTIVDNCTIINTGKDIVALPGAGIDMECYRDRESVEPFRVLEYARVENVTVRNCDFDNNYNNDIVLFNPTNFVDVSYNTFTKGVSSIVCDNVRIHHNTFTSGFPNLIGYQQNQGVGIASAYASAGTPVQLVHDIEVDNNTFSGYLYSIAVAGDNSSIHNNTITNGTKIGISVGNDVDTQSIYGNSITMDNAQDTAAIRNFLGTTSSRNITLDDNICSGKQGIRLNGLTGVDNGWIITNSTFTGVIDDLWVDNSSNITFGAGNTYTNVRQSGNTNVTIP
jgi:hypothetical protein